MSVGARTAFIAALAGLITWAGHAPAQVTFDAANRQLAGDWVVECLADRAPSPDSCQLYQRILTQDPNTAALIVALVWRADQNALYLQAALPLGVDLRVPPELRVDGTMAETFVWARCLKAGCFVEAALSAATFDRLQQGQGASVMITIPGSGAIDIPLSLAGFNDGLSAIKAQAADG